MPAASYHHSPSRGDKRAYYRYHTRCSAALVDVARGWLRSGHGAPVRVGEQAAGAGLPTGAPHAL